MAYYGTRRMRGEAKRDMKKLTEAILEMHDIHAGGVEEEIKRGKGRKMLKLLKNPLLDKDIYESRTEGYDVPDWLAKIFPKFSKKIEEGLAPIEYGDPEAISSLETMWTKGMAGEEAETLERMIGERDVPYWETFLGERKSEFDTVLKLLPLFTSMGGSLPQIFAREGGYVPKYYGGGSVTGGGTTPTITDYFNKQGKTLGGSNIESIGEKLNRRV